MWLFEEAMQEAMQTPSPLLGKEISEGINTTKNKHENLEPWT